MDMVTHIIYVILILLYPNKEKNYSYSIYINPIKMTIKIKITIVLFKTDNIRGWQKIILYIKMS